MKKILFISILVFLASCGKNDAVKDSEENIGSSQIVEWSYVVRDRDGSTTEQIVVPVDSGDTDALDNTDIIHVFE